MGRSFRAWLVGGIATELAIVAGFALTGPSLPAQPPAPEPPILPAPETDRGLSPLPIDLPTALKLANARAVDVAAAAARVQVASALLKQAQVLWLPTVTAGVDYYRHDGKIQDTAGNIIDVSRNAFMVGAGSGVGATSVVPVSDAVFAPLAARQVLRARQADLQAAANDTLVAVTDAYFTVEQALGELAGAEDTVRRAGELVRRTRSLAEGLVPPVEAVRAEAELVRRQQAALQARQNWRVASAELLRVLRLDPAAEVRPAEPPHLLMQVVALDRPAGDLIALALTYRPELASRQALVQAALAQVRQERSRLLMPSVQLRGAATNPAGTLGVGLFGGGGGGATGGWGGRSDIDLQLLWQADNLGFGNKARVEQRRAEGRLAEVELAREMDRVAAEVAQALAQAQLAAARVGLAERGVRLSLDSAEKNLIALGQTRRAGDLVVTLVRPQEAVAAVQALAQAYADYYGAVADSNRAQFRLYRAIGQPAQCLERLTDPAPPPAMPPLTGKADGRTGGAPVTPTAGG
jgi:outer membrane protein TolC